MATWPETAARYADLARVEVRDFGAVSAQYNPARMVSTGPRSIRRRWPSGPASSARTIVLRFNRNGPSARTSTCSSIPSPSSRPISRSPPGATAPRRSSTPSPRSTNWLTASRAPCSSTTGRNVGPVRPTISTSRGETEVWCRSAATGADGGSGYGRWRGWTPTTASAPSRTTPSPPWC